jgi:hypothetical protein
MSLWSQWIAAIDRHLDAWEAEVLAEAAAPLPPAPALPDAYAMDGDE